MLNTDVLIMIVFFAIVAAFSISVVYANMVRGEPMNPVESFSYTDTTETKCINNNDGTKTCTVTSYPFRAFADNEGNTITDLSDLTFTGNGFVFNYNNTRTEIKPYIYVFGSRRYLDDMRMLGVMPTHEIAKSRFDYKYSLGLGNIVTTIDCMGFEIINRNKEISFVFSDLEASNFAVDYSNRDDISICNLSRNVIDLSLLLDPSISLSSGNISADVEYASPGARPELGFAMKWSMPGVAKENNVQNSTMCIWQSLNGLIVLPDTDCNSSRMDNQTWVETISAGEYFDMPLTNSSLAHAWSYATDGKDEYWCINTTDIVREESFLGSDNVSMIFSDPDFVLETGGAITDDTRLGFGQLAKADFFSREDCGAKCPYLNMTYTVEANPPTVELISPAQGENIPVGIAIQSNFTCEVIDDSEIDNVNVWSDFRNGTWMLEQTNTTIGIMAENYTFYQNFTDWFDGEQVCLFTGTQLADDTGQRDITFNGTDWWISSYNDDWIYHWNTSCQNASLGFIAPDSTISGIGNNNTNLVMVDSLSKKLYYHKIDGTAISNCVISRASILDGVDIGNDGTIYVTDSIKNLVFRTNETCDDLGNFTTGIGSPQSISVSGDVAFILDKFYTPDFIMVWNITSNRSIENITFAPIIDGSSPYVGIAINKSASYDYWTTERIFITQASPNELTFVGRLTNRTGLKWNCYACDAFDNCAWAASNFTFNVINITAPIDTCTYSGSGNWNVKCPDNCTIIIETDLLGNNLTIDGGTGMFTMTANKINWHSVESYCNVEQRGGYFI